MYNQLIILGVIFMSIDKLYILRDFSYIQPEALKNINEIIKKQQPVIEWGEEWDSFNILNLNHYFSKGYGCVDVVRFEIYVGVNSFINVTIGDEDNEYGSHDFYKYIIPNIRKLDGEYNVHYNNIKYNITITDNLNLCEMVRNLKEEDLREYHKDIK